MTAEERQQLVDDIVGELERRGAPQGTWLVELAQVRQALLAAETLCRRLENAIIRDAAGRPELPR